MGETEKKDLPTLQVDVAKKYKAKNVVPGLVHFKGQEYDLTKINLPTAEVLMKDKFPYLEEISTDVKSVSPQTKAVN